ncbi:MAG: hypothetical protein WC480_01375 [Patescibacteria group bacterium]
MIYVTQYGFLKIISILFLVLFLFNSLLTPALAVENALLDIENMAKTGAQVAGEGGYYTGDDPAVGAKVWVESTSYIIRIIITFVGVLFFVLMIYGGVLWMTAGGNEEQVKKARSILIQALVGIVIVFAAYAVTVLVFYVLGSETSGVYNVGEMPTDTPEVD